MRLYDQVIRRNKTALLRYKGRVPLHEYCAFTVYSLNAREGIMGSVQCTIDGRIKKNRMQNKVCFTTSALKNQREIVLGSFGHKRHIYYLDLVQLG